MSFWIRCNFRPDLTAQQVRTCCLPFLFKKNKNNLCFQLTQWMNNNWSNKSIKCYQQLPKWTSHDKGRNSILFWQSPNRKWLLDSSSGLYPRRRTRYREVRFGCEIRPRQRILIISMHSHAARACLNELPVWRHHVFFCFLFFFNGKTSPSQLYISVSLQSSTQGSSAGSYERNVLHVRSKETLPMWCNFTQMKSARGARWDMEPFNSAGCSDVYLAKSMITPSSRTTVTK